MTTARDTQNWSGGAAGARASIATHFTVATDSHQILLSLVPASDSHQILLSLVPASDSHQILLSLVPASDSHQIKAMKFLK